MSKIRTAPKWQRARSAGIYLRHEHACPANDGKRCNCKPSYRAQAGRGRWSPTFKDEHAALEWRLSARNGTIAPVADGPTFGELVSQWWEGVQAGTIGKRKGRKGDGYSATTLADYERSLRILKDEHGERLAASLDPAYWQAWIDRRSREGLSRSRLQSILAVVSAAYGWGSRATRKLVPSNPVRDIELPPNDERPRERVATAEEAAALLDALPPDIRVPYALAFYAGLRRSEIHRLKWGDVDLTTKTITVRRSKSKAGTGRVVPIAAPLVAALKSARRPILDALSHGSAGSVCARSVMSGKLAEAARKAWETCAWCHGTGKVRGRVVRAGVEYLHGADCPGCDGTGKRDPMLQPIGLHECRHTYASLLVAAGYNLKEVMVFMGHADLQTTSRYVKRLPQPGEMGVADRLNRYLGVAA